MSNLPIQEIIDLFNQKMTPTAISRIYNVSPSTIFNLLIQHYPNFRTLFPAKHYTYNKSYFDVIDTEAKAYFLGFMYADGSVMQGRCSCIKLSLALVDFSILEKFKQELEYTGPITDYYRSRINLNWQDIKELRISGKILGQSLIKLGCTPKKTFTLKFPTEEQVPSHLIPHFIRGFFDGDGSISYNKSNKNLIVRFEGTVEFLNSLQNYLISTLNFNITKLTKRHKDRDDNIYTLSCGGNNKCLKFKELIYKDATIFLERKYEKFN